MTHEACESKLRSVVRLSMHPYPGNWVASGDQSFSVPGPPAHLVQELNVGTVFRNNMLEFCDWKSPHQWCQHVYGQSDDFLLQTFNIPIAYVVIVSFCIVSLSLPLHPSDPFQPLETSKQITSHSRVSTAMK